MTLHEFEDGTILEAEQLNSNFGATKIHELYTGTSLDVAATTSGSSTHEFNTVAPSSINNAEYVSISPLFTSELDPNSGSRATVSFKVEIKEVGGSYSTIFDKPLRADSDNNNQHYAGSPRIYHSLTSGEKSSGFIIKATSTVSVSTAGTASILIENVVIKLEA